MDFELPEGFNVEDMLQRMQPISTPRQILESVPQLERRLAKWNKLRAVAALAGLQTDPAFQGNTIRLCWATRLVLALSDGEQIIARAPLTQLLNADMKKGDVTRLEDPIEDFFVAPLATSRGEFRIFTGSWQNAQFHTDCMLQAFEQLSDAPPKQTALNHVYALLQLSDAIVERAKLERRMVGGGKPAGIVTLPAEQRLRALGRRVYFLWEELEALGLTLESLAPFCLAADEIDSIIDTEPGKSALDYRPLLIGYDGIVAASPANISTAIRAHLIECATTYNVADVLQYSLLGVQADRLSETRFIDADNWQTMKPNGILVRQGVKEISTGRYLHGIQILDDFADWTEHGFGVTAPSDPAVAEVILEGARFAHAQLKDRPGFKEAATIILLGGWGRSRALEFSTDPELKNWPFLVMEVGDAPTMSGCEDGKITDLWRINKQLMASRAMGFKIENLSGTLNLFQWWRNSDFALVPPDQHDMQPPMGIMIPTDSLLEARLEGDANHDRRAVPFCDGTYMSVLRLEPHSYFTKHDPLYGSYDAARDGQLLAVCLAGIRPVWIELAHDQGERALHDCYQTWRAALHWLVIALPVFDEQYPSSEIDPVLIKLRVDWPDEFIDTTLTDAEIDEAIEFTCDLKAQTAALRLDAVWQHGLRRTNNRAEVGLAAAMLACVAELTGRSADSSQLIALVERAAGSPDVRWRHSFFANHVIDALRVHGLIEDEFVPVSQSATALVKYGSALMEGITPGMKIEGKAECFAFLMRLHEASLSWLCDFVARFDRQDLVSTALTRFQLALSEESQWARTARAVRGIHGHASDQSASFDQRIRINAAVRACSMLAEIAAVQSPLVDGFAVGDMDYDEMQALALMHFQVCELVPAIQGDRMPPELVISPTGDLLYNHEFGESTLQPSVVQLHVEDRQRADDTYGDHYSPPAPSKSEPDLQFLLAIEAEYRAPSRAFVDFSAATLELAEEDNKGVLVLKRSELLDRLKSTKYCGEFDLAELVDRLTLACRESWSDIPENAAASDFDLGRFDRRFSLIGRPLVAITAGEDPLLVIAPGIIERSARHNIAGAAEGGLQGQFWTSKEMRSFVGAAGKRAGMAFNENVAQTIGELGLIASASIKPSACLNHKATDALKALGDIDVLALTPDGKHAWVIEAKDIKLCRTLAETAQRLSEYRGQALASGKPDNLLRHLNRVAYVRAHAADLAKRSKLSDIPQIHGMVVIDSPQPMAFSRPHESTDANFVRLNDIGAVPWARGWSRKKKET